MRRVGVFNNMTANLLPRGYSDGHVVELVCQGQSEMFAELIERYQRKIFAYVYRLCNSHRDDALDVVQNVFLKAYENLRSFNPRRSFSAWLYRIAHNEAINLLKRERRRAALSLDDNPFLENTLTAADNPEEQVLKQESQTLVAETLAGLPAKYREVLILRFMEEKSYEEMSGVLRKPMNTIATLVARGKRRFADRLQQKLK